MSLHSLTTLIKYLPDDEALTFLAREGLDLEVVPDEDLRGVIEWALVLLRTSGRAPSVAVIKERWGDLLSDREIDIEEEPEDSIEWAVDKTKADWVKAMASRLAREFVTAVTQAGDEDRVEVFTTKAAEHIGLALKLQPRTTGVDLRDAAEGLLAEYERVAANGNPVRGMCFGLPEIDAYTRGIHEGELAILAAPPKTGKSFLADHIAYHEWKRGRGVALYTLENSINATLMRLAAIALGISTLALMDGKLDAEDLDKLRTWVREEIPRSSVPLHVMHPNTVARTAPAIVQGARAHGCDSLIIDQLSHLDHPDPNHRMSRPTEIKDIVDDLVALISTGRQPLPCLLVHQINRAGVEHFDKTGRLRMDHAAEGAVERYADWLFALTASDMDVKTHRATLHTLASRRVPPQDWWLGWNIEVGRISVGGPVDLSDAA